MKLEDANGSFRFKLHVRCATCEIAPRCRACEIEPMYLKVKTAYSYGEQAIPLDEYIAAQTCCASKSLKYYNQLQFVAGIQGSNLFVLPNDPDLAGDYEFALDIAD